MLSIASLAVIPLAYILLRVIYNTWFHPLAHVPGPRSWSATRLPFIWALLRGTIVHDFQRLHRRYGPVVRTAPDEVSISDGDGWTDIYSANSPFLKDPTWWKSQPGHPDSLLSAINPDKHAIIRKALSPGFTPRALRAQEPLLQKYVNLLVQRLHERVEKADIGYGGKEKGVEINMTPWFNYTTFDIFGELGFGESFKCLEHSQYHPWISLLFNSVKAASFVAAARFYPLLESLLMRLIPPALRKMQKDHFQQIADKVQRRLGWELQQPDIMSHLIGEGGKLELPLGELNATFMILTTAGSETTATVLTGTLNYLVNNPEKLAILVDEVRSTFHGVLDISMDAVRNLPYLNAVINEGLRLCPPVPWMLPRLVPGGGRVISRVWLPEGTRVSLQPYSLYRDPKKFHQATTFIPERWLPIQPSSPFFRDDRSAVQPFSMGTRSCMGVYIAWAEMRLILAKLLFEFDFECIHEKQLRWEELRTFLLVEKRPLEVRVSSVKNQAA
ncbi:uncharacterized protein TRUGW13939_11284 [Talaromyces rugulosus]|uniref:Cytochrome P450 n=1 Tax=Talaromyces rugulosus TaxID=121627 RepID=A0A7H8REI5_TALRU|nr:uncharacterized protein TRUGW13939_11284 [Talaromyces rugulosus]QKX64111.1 hypothetical protein TRUGW13939_11284 [Talaromyces rugulosus]